MALDDISDAGRRDIPPGLIIDVGPGEVPGHTLLDLSPEMREKVEAGNPFLSISNKAADLDNPTLGRTQLIDIDDFLESDQEDGSVAYMHIGNVFSVLSQQAESHSKAAERLHGIVKKLIPGKGIAVILENYTPSVSESLKKIPFGALGIEAEVISGADAYRAKLSELGIKESETATWFASMYSQSGHPWIPFIIILKRPLQS